MKGVDIMKVVYPGTFDGLHYGHLDIMERASRMFDEVIIAIGNNETKKPLFNANERYRMLKETLQNYNSNISVYKFNGMLNDFMWKRNINIVVRGVRNEDDFKSVKNTHDFIWKIDKSYETIPLISNIQHRNLSSSMVKAVEHHGGDISHFVPPNIKRQLEKKISERIFIGITGMMGAGKNFIVDLLMRVYPRRGKSVYSIDFDRLVRDIHTKLIDTRYIEFRKELIKKFGLSIHDKSRFADFHYFINTKELAKIVFNKNSKYELKYLSDMLYEPAMHYFRDYLRMRDLRGVIFLNCPYLIEYNLINLCNGNMVIINADDEVRKERVMKRDGITEEEFLVRSSHQLSFEGKKLCLDSWKNAHPGCNFWTLKNNQENCNKIYELCEVISDELSF